MVNNLWQRKSKGKHVKQESVDSGDISSNNKDIDREEERRHRRKKKNTSEFVAVERHGHFLKL